MQTSPVIRLASRKCPRNDCHLRRKLPQLYASVFCEAKHAPASRKAREAGSS